MLYPALRSQKSLIRCYIRFVNFTERSVNIVWINFSGQYVSYRILKPGQFVDVNTFKTHPWVVFDCKTKDRLHLNKDYVYNPQTFSQQDGDSSSQLRLQQSVEGRLIVGVTIPVHTLKSTVLLYLKNNINDSHNVDQLDLPKYLSDALKVLIQKKNNLNTLPLFSILSPIPRNQ